MSSLKKRLRGRPLFWPPALFVKFANLTFTLRCYMLDSTETKTLPFNLSALG